MDDTITTKEQLQNGPNKTKDQTNLRGEFLRGKEDIQSLSRDWDNLFKRAKDAPVYLSRAWIQTFINHNRFKGKPCLIVVWKDSKLVALLPFYVQRICGISVGKLIGTEEPSYLGLLLDPEYPEAVAVVAETWIREKVAYAFQNKHVFSLDKATHDFIKELNRHGFVYKYGYKRICLCIELGCSFDEFIKKFKSSKSRQTIRRKERKLFENNNVKLDHFTGNEITPQILERIAQIQNESWMKKRGAAILGQPFYQNLLTHMAEAGLSSLWLMTINGDDAAFVYSFITNGKLYYHWPAFKLKYESGLSIGQILLMQSIRDACKEGVRFFDFGHGDAEYKRFWANKTQSVDWVVAGRGLPGHAVILCYRIAWWLAGQKKLFQFYRRLKNYRKNKNTASSDN
jgi:CelD/BcsL family acetyltransferase involved in cellulose biosynthesis